MRKLRIAQVAPVWFPVPPKKYGGTERIISFLTESFVKKGHQVTLFASGDSKTKARLISPLKKGAVEMGVKWGAYWWNNLIHSQAFTMAKEFDIIHCHWGIMGAYFQRMVKAKVLHTQHNIPESDPLRWQVYKYFQNDLNLAFISKSEMRNAPIKFKNSWVIYNGIDMTPFKFNPKPEDYLIWIARVCPAKGPETAIKIAKKAGVKLIMAGQIQPQHQDYFKERIQPHLSSKIQFVGELGLKEVAEFYAKGKACLYPIDWEEPFGLVMAESMACGTPVIGFNRGSVPEIIKDGKTGFIVDTIDQAVKKIPEIDTIDRMACRKHIEDNFTLEKMSDEYEKLYYEMLARK